MTTIRFERASETGSCIRFHFSGHAGFAKKGEDIVCAALSALSINTINSLQRFCDTRLSVRSDEKTGEIECILPKQQNEKERLLIDALILGARSIEEEYGRKYSQVIEEEV